MASRLQTNAFNTSPLDDICPVCKSNRYLNPSLTFLINSECYHTMCTSCVDRIFTSGPAPCPVAGCHRTLRKRGFHPAFFGDLSIEREVDVRKRVGAVFNRRQDDFESLRDWNDYLESVEDLVFKLTEGSAQERREADAALKGYAEMNRREIEENEKMEKEEEEVGRQAQAEADERARRRREEVRMQDAEEKRDLERTRRQAIENLTRAEGNAEEITRSNQELIMVKKEKMKVDQREDERKDVREDERKEQSAMPKGLKGLKKRRPVEVEKPYDPFGGVDLTPTRYVLQKHYKNDWLKPAENDPRHMVGGYNMQEYYARSMFEAFSGLGVFIEDELADKSAEEGTAAAASAAQQG